MTWYEITQPETIASPALLVYRNRVVANIRRMIQLAGGPDRLRPHVKTHKMRAVTDLMLAEGIRQFKCATLKEARMLADAAGNGPGAPAVDVLVAYALVGPAVAHLASLRAEYPAVRFSCLIDAVSPARSLSDAFSEDPLEVYIDLNVGMNRTGIRPTDAPALHDYCQTLPGIRIAGLHAYDGHIRDTDLSRRTQRTNETFAQADAVRQLLQTGPGDSGPDNSPWLLVMGGSPTFACHARQPNVVVSPGTVVFWDAGYAETMPDLPFEVAAVLLTRVISVLDSETLCFDLGHKSVAAENPLPRVRFLNQPDAQPISQSEEHLVVRVADAHQHPPGTVWYGVPIHICPTVNLYDSVSVITANRQTDTWAVTARGH